MHFAIGSGVPRRLYRYTGGQTVPTVRGLPMYRTALATIAIAGLLGCGSPTSSDAIAVQFVAVPTLGGSFSLVLNGQTYTSSSLQTAMLSPGSYDVTGTATGTTALGTQLLVGFTGGGTAVARGGVRSGSVVALAGPVASTAGCGIGFFVQNAGPMQFQFRLTVTSDPASAC